MLTKSMPVAIVTGSQAEAELITQGLAECGFRSITVFTSGKEAFAVCARQQFALFVTRVEIPDMSGLVVIQKLRATGNYGLEPHLLICNKLDSQLLSLISEYDLDYVAVPPITKATIAAKFKHLITTENALSEIELKYRDSKSAFASDLMDMAEHNIQQVLKVQPTLEKALILYGDIELKRNKLDAANSHYKAAIAANPKSSTGLHRLAQLLMKQNDFNAAAMLLNKLADVNPHNIKLLENAGLSNLNIERYDLAKNYMGKLQAVDAGNKVAATVTAQVKIKTGDLSNLADGLRQGMDDKEMVQFLNNAGAKLSSENDIDGAIKMYMAAVEQIKSNKFLYAIHYNLGIAFKKKKEFAKARQNFERSIKLNPEFTKATTALQELPAS